MILDALRTVVEQRLPALPAVGLMTFAPPLAVEVPASGSSLPADVPARTMPPTPPRLRGRSIGDRGWTRTQSGSRRGSCRNPRPLAGLDTAAAGGDRRRRYGRGAGRRRQQRCRRNGPQRRQQGDPSRRPGRPGPLGQAAVTVAEQAQTALKSIGDAVGKAAGRASRAASGSDSGR